MLVLNGCKTNEITNDYELPSLTAFEPSLAPVGLVLEPETQQDLLHNSVTWEFWGYEWQDYAISLNDWFNDLKIPIK